MYYNYGNPSTDAVDYIMSRLSSISDSQSSQSDAAYTYLGLNTIIKEDSQRAGFSLRRSQRR